MPFLCRASSLYNWWPLDLKNETEMRKEYHEHAQIYRGSIAFRSYAALPVLEMWSPSRGSFAECHSPVLSLGWIRQPLLL